MPALPEPLRKNCWPCPVPAHWRSPPDILACWEGHAIRPYADSGGVLMVCYGHTGDGITTETTQTPAQCEALLVVDIHQAFAVINQQATILLSDW